MRQTDVLTVTSRPAFIPDALRLKTRCKVKNSSTLKKHISHAFCFIPSLHHVELFLTHERSALREEMKYNSMCVTKLKASPSRKNAPIGYL